MKNKNLLSAIILAVGLIVASVIYAYSTRYVIREYGRIDKWNGTIEMLKVIEN